VAVGAKSFFPQMVPAVYWPRVVPVCASH
jgi:hypothetical protein